MPEAVGVARPHRRTVREPPVELGLDERTDVDAVDGQALDLAADLHPPDGGAADHDVGEEDVAQSQAREVARGEAGSSRADVADDGAGEVDLLGTHVPEGDLSDGVAGGLGGGVVGHGATVGPVPDGARPVPTPPPRFGAGWLARLAS